MSSSSPPGGFVFQPAGGIAEPSGRGVRGGCCERRRQGTNQEHHRTHHGNVNTHRDKMSGFQLRLTFSFSATCPPSRLWYQLSTWLSWMELGNVCQYQRADYCRIACFCVWPEQPVHRSISCDVYFFSLHVFFPQCMLSCSLIKDCSTEVVGRGKKT